MLAQEPFHLGVGQAPKPQGDQPGTDRRQQPIRVDHRQDELSVRRRLFQELYLEAFQEADVAESARRLAAF